MWAEVGCIAQRRNAGLSPANFPCSALELARFLLIGLKNLLTKIHNSLDTFHSASNLGFILDEHLTFFHQITALSKACYYNIRQFYCIRPYFDSSATCTIAISIIHSKLDYCNSLHYIIPSPADPELSCR